MHPRGLVLVREGHFASRRGGLGLDWVGLGVRHGNERKMIAVKSLHADRRPLAPVRFGHDRWNLLDRISSCRIGPITAAKKKVKS